MGVFVQRIGILEQAASVGPAPGVTVITYAIPGALGDFNDPEDTHDYAVPGALGDIDEAS